MRPVSSNPAYKDKAVEYIKNPMGMDLRSTGAEDRIDDKCCGTE